MVFRAFSCTFFGGRKADESHHFFEAGRLLWNVDISGQGGNQIRYAIVIRIIRGRILRWVWMKGVMTGAISQDISEPLHIIAVLRLVLPERERRRPIAAVKILQLVELNAKPFGFSKSLDLSVVCFLRCKIG